MPIRIDEPSSIFDLSRGLHVRTARLRAAIKARAGMLQRAGARPGSRVVICHDDELAFLIDLLAGWAAGAVCAPLSPSLTGDERRRMAARLSPTLWIGPFEDAACSLLSPFDIEHDEDAQSFTLHSDATTSGDRPVDAPALVLTTSGTTGAPKCVQISAAALAARLTLNQSYIGSEALARTLLTLPLHFGHGLIGNALTPLAAGGCLFVGLSHELDERPRLGATIDAHQISFITSVPSFWRMSLRLSPRPQAGSLKRVHVGSERLPSDLWQRISAWSGAPVYNMYGMTECANWIGGVAGEEVAFAEGSVGVPWGGQFRIASSNPQAEAGEILVQSPSMMQSYLDDPTATNEAIGTGWLHTGDLGLVDAAGRLRITGRIKHQINRAGTKISAEEIDALVEQHEAVLQCCAFAVADPVTGERVAVAIVLRDECTLDADDLSRWCRQRIRQEAVPEAVYFVDALARNARGKIDRGAVRNQVTSATTTPITSKP